MKIRGTCSPPTTQHTTPNQVSLAVLVMLVMCEYRDIVCSDQARGQLGDRRAFQFSQKNALHQDEEQSHHACECPSESALPTTIEFK